MGPAALISLSNSSEVMTLGYRPQPSRGVLFGSAGENPVARMITPTSNSIILSLSEGMIASCSHLSIHFPQRIKSMPRHVSGSI